MKDLAAVRLALARAAHALPDDDVRLLAALAAELPIAKLAARLEGETARGVERRNGPAVETLPTSRASIARTRLLSAFDAWSALLGLPPRARRTVGDYLAGNVPALPPPAKRA